MPRPTVLLGFLGTNLDSGHNPKRWARWRPTVGACSQEDLLVSRFELLYPPWAQKTAEVVIEDIGQVSPTTEVRPHVFPMQDPWDFGQVYADLLDFARAYPFDPDEEDYLVHITTGTHVAQICLFLLTEARFLPARLLQTGPHLDKDGPVAGRCSIIDLDLSRYDAIARRFAQEQQEATSFLKDGIETRNAGYNSLIDEIELVAGRSPMPILLMGPTGAGKSRLARRIFELKRARRLVQGGFVEVNCATLRGDQAMGALFGHTRGAFTGAVKDRPGLLRTADGGVLFLDEIGELGLDEQAMLLRALESGCFLPVGADREVESRFQLIAGTNRDLRRAVAQGEFRADLLARIDTWTWTLPALKDRPEDIEPNLVYELERIAREASRRVTFNREAKDRFLAFATDPGSSWARNFRDLGAAVQRMAVLAPGGRIGLPVVEAEMKRLQEAWAGPEAPGGTDDDHGLLVEVMGPDRAADLDRFDAVQLAEVIRVCRRSRSLADAGRSLFAVSRTRRSSINDSDRLRKYLARFDLDWEGISGG